MDGEMRREPGHNSNDDADAKPISLIEFFRRFVRFREEPYKDLKVVNVDLMINQNSLLHYTDKYIGTCTSSGPLVVRRGFPFLVKLLFSRRFDLLTDKLSIVLNTGDNPLPGDMSWVSLSLSSDPLEQWRATIRGDTTNEMTIEIYTPPDCIVSKWRLEIGILEDKAEEKTIHVNSEIYPIDVYILFNPWNKADNVYIDDDDCRMEYVLEDEGNIWIDKPRHNKAWNFGQFEEHILECTMYLLDKSNLRMKNRGNPVLVSRKLSALGNSFDNDGVLVGNWTGPYEDGKSPSMWNGSIRILQEYWRTKQPVKYGQCWVFSGILTTMCRAIGIPCRSVTNFSSAHDSDGSITIDEYFTMMGVKLSDNDSVWNFHVWNEVWMARPDLPEEKRNPYGGWQVLDCTPQEPSGKFHQCGPMPVAAIKAGDLTHLYDGPFIFAEVNADRVTWLYDENIELHIAEIETSSIGNYISTRALPKHWSYGMVTREDITDSYKYKEGSPEEKKARLAAYKTSSKDITYKLDEKKIVEYKFERAEDIDYGQDIAVKVKAKNTGTESVTVSGFITIKSADYTFKTFKDLETKQFKTALAAGKEIALEMNLTQENYLDKVGSDDKLKDRCYIIIEGVFISKKADMETTGTGQGKVIRDIFSLTKPSLQLKTFIDGVEVDEVEMKTPFMLEISFTNPLRRTLTECEIDLDGTGIKGPDDKDLKQRNVGPMVRFYNKVEVTASKKGSRRINVVFNAKEMIDVSGSITVKVK